MTSSGDWAAHINSASDRFGGALNSIESLCQLCCSAAPSAATTEYLKQITATTNALIQALEGASMLAVGLQSVPSEQCDPIQTSRTVFGLVLSQLASYYDEMQAATTNATRDFATEKSQLLGLQGTVSRQPSKQEAEKKPKKTKDKKQPVPEAIPVELGSSEASTTSLGAALAESSPEPEKLQSPAKKKKDKAEPTEEVATHNEANSAPNSSAEHLPFLKVRNTLADSLGVAVITTRPEVYLPFEKIVAEADVKADRCEQRYYLSCPSLSELLITTLSSSVTDEELASKQQDATLDLLCDALLCEDINVLAFTNAKGEVVLDGSQALPACAWRCADGAAGGSDATLDTFFAFINHQSNGLGECLIFHDVLVRSEHEREQVVHIVKPVDKPGILEVSVHHPPAALLGGAANAGALPSLYRRFFSTFFPECTYHRDGAKGAAAGDTAQLRKAKADAAAIAVLNQQKEEAAAASAKASKKGSKGLIGKTKDLTMAIATAPLAAVSALNDASQAAIFRNSFPELEEDAHASFNCAWANGKILKQGYVYATERHLCFQGTVLAAKFILAYDEIEKMSKKKNTYFDNSIEIEDYQGNTYFLTSFVSRDEAYKVLFKSWTGQ